MKTKILNELRSIFLGSLYFLTWFGILVLIKWLLLSEYNIEVTDLTKAIIGALVVTKVVLVLDNLPMSGVASYPAITGILIRTLLYMAGVLVVMVLERSFEARHEYDGFLDALLSANEHVNGYHFAVSAICVFGAMFLWNTGRLLNEFLRPDGLSGFLLTPTDRILKEKSASEHE